MNRLVNRIHRLSRQFSATKFASREIILNPNLGTGAFNDSNSNTNGSSWLLSSLAAMMFLGYVSTSKEVKCDSKDKQSLSAVYFFNPALVFSFKSYCALLIILKFKLIYYTQTYYFFFSIYDII